MRPLDWFAPVGLCVGGAALCIWRAIAADSDDGRLVCIMVATVLLLILGSFVVMRTTARAPDYTLHGVKVVLGDFNRPTKIQVSMWIQRVIIHWASQEQLFSASDLSVVSTLKGTTIFYLDKEKLTSWGRAVRGYTNGKDVVVGNTINGIESLTVHELSHVVLDKMGIQWNETLHHQLFLSTKLGA